MYEERSGNCGASKRVSVTELMGELCQSETSAKIWAFFGKPTTPVNVAVTRTGKAFLKHRHSSVNVGIPILLEHLPVGEEGEFPANRACVLHCITQRRSGVARTLGDPQTTLQSSAEEWVSG